MLINHTVVTRPINSVVARILWQVRFDIIVSDNETNIENGELLDLTSTRRDDLEENCQWKLKRKCFRAKHSVYDADVGYVLVR